MKNRTLLDPSQIEATKEGYDNLFEQIEYGRFNSVKSGAAPTLYQEIKAEEGQTIFSVVAGRFVMGDHSLQVYVNGMLMREGHDNDYIELDNRRIQFMFALTSVDVVLLRVAGGTSGAALHNSFKALEGQTVFNLHTSYTTGNNSLVVYVSGAYQTLGIDYVETDAKTVTFLDPLEEGDLVTFRVEGLPSEVSKYADTEIITTYDNDNKIIKKEVFGDSHISTIYEYDQDGYPSRMITREGGYLITKEYEWTNGLCTHIQTSTREGV